MCVHMRACGCVHMRACGCVCVWMCRDREKHSEIIKKKKNVALLLRTETKGLTVAYEGPCGLAFFPV